MGTNDRDYWREKYNETTNYTEKSSFRVGLSDPTHWREDELSASRQRGPSKQKSSKGGSSRNLAIWLAVLLVLVVAVEGYKLFSAHRIMQIPIRMMESISQDQRQREAQQRRVQALEQQRLEAEHRAQAAAAAELRQKEHERERREAAKAVAWANYYQPSAFCKANATVECANAYIRAKNKFNAEWTD